MRKPRIVIVGDIIKDQWSVVQKIGVAPEPSDIPKYVSSLSFQSDGGAGNIARHLEKLGAAWQLLGGNGGQKFRYWDGKKIIFRLDADRRVTPGERSRAAENAAFYIRQGADVLILSDYGKGTLEPYETKSLIQVATENDVVVLVDPKDKSPALYPNAIIKCNKAYFDCYRDEFIQEHIVTNDKDTVCFYSQGIASRFEIPASQSAKCVVGAGDCFMAHLAYWIGIGIQIGDAIGRADCAARLFCTLGPDEERSVYANLKEESMSCFQ